MVSVLHTTERLADEIAFPRMTVIRVSYALADAFHFLPARTAGVIIAEQCFRICCKQFHCGAHDISGFH